MSAKGQLLDRARDELFSHINRCGVLAAAEDDQRQWMDETIEYLAERYPDLGDADLRELHTLGMRFCRPAIPHGADEDAGSGEEAPDSPAAPARPEGASEGPPGAADDEGEARVESAEGAR